VLCFFHLVQYQKVLRGSVAGPIATGLFTFHALLSHFLEYLIEHFKKKLCAAAVEIEGGRQLGTNPLTPSEGELRTWRLSLTLGAVQARSSISQEVCEGEGGLY